MHIFPNPKRCLQMRKTEKGGVCGRWGVLGFNTGRVGVVFQLLGVYESKCKWLKQVGEEFTDEEAEEEGLGKI